MALSDCVECWMTPCECGHDFKNVSSSYKEKMTKSINGFTVEDIFDWLSKKDYLSDSKYIIFEEFKKEH